MHRIYQSQCFGELETDFVDGPKQIGVTGVVGDIAGVVRDAASMVGAVANVEGGAIDADWICVPSVIMAAKLLEPMVQVIWPTVNVRLSTTAAKSGMMTIWFVWKLYAPPYLARHCQRNMVSSLPRGMSKVVDCW